MKTTLSNVDSKRLFFWTKEGGKERRRREGRKERGRGPIDKYVWENSLSLLFPSVRFSIRTNIKGTEKSCSQETCLNIPFLHLHRRTFGFCIVIVATIILTFC